MPACRAGLCGATSGMMVRLRRPRVLAGRLAFVRVRYTGANGETRPLTRGVLTASVEGGDLLGFGCASPFNEGSFVTGETQTYFGEALAVVRPAPGSGCVRLSVTDGTLSASLELPVV